MAQEWVQMLGFAAGTMTTAAFVPQVVKTWRSRSAGDISLGMYAVLTCGVFSWLAYGLLVGDWPVVAANGVTLVLVAAMLAMKLVFR